jgi:hypothetical protein
MWRVDRTGTHRIDDIDDIDDIDESGDDAG